MRYVSFAFLVFCACVTGVQAQTRSSGDDSAAPSAADADFPSKPAQDPVDLHVDAQKKHAAAAATARAKAEARARSLRGLPEVRMFCANNASTADAARIAWQASRLEEVEARLQEKIAELDAKRAEFQEWMRKRDEAMKKARQDVVDVYSKMDPEAAANELMQMDDAMAAAVLSKLNPRTTSSILDQMDPARAAHLTDEMMGADSGDGKRS
jgi:flagellar motility protein MotE (MotC chaperone)